MAVYFNDLTIVKDDPHQNCRLLPEFWKLMQKLQVATEKRVQFAYANEGINPLTEAVYTSGNPDLYMKYGTYIKRPFHDDDARELMEKVEEHAGGDAEYHIEAEGADSIECKMLGWAHHERSITVGLASSAFWGQLSYPVKRETFEDDELVVDVVESVCVTNEKQIDLPRVKGWIVAQREFESVELPQLSVIPIADKRIHYCDDHGKEILDAFARRLVRCGYVDAVINSTEWRIGCNQLIYDIREDGVVYLCLHWCEDRYGLAVQTTARGILQTQLVAEILREKFDRRS